MLAQREAKDLSRFLSPPSPSLPSMMNIAACYHPSACRTAVAPSPRPTRLGDPADIFSGCRGSSCAVKHRVRHSSSVRGAHRKAASQRMEGRAASLMTRSWLP